MDFGPCFGSKKGNVTPTKKVGSNELRKNGQVTAGPLDRVPSVRSNYRSGSDSKKENSAHRSALRTAVQTFTFRELAMATRNFRQESLLGEGGFGRVYKGLLGTWQVVAVKQLDKHSLQGNREFLVEVLMLCLLHHPNLVNLIGYCADGDQRLLVYEFMPLGSLSDHLHDLTPDKEALDWNTRMRIAAGVAKGLEYLHDKAKPSVIYRDLKSSNILLGEGFFPKLSDFGLAKLGPVGDKTHVSTRVMGTYGYCAPEYAMTGQLTAKSDVYSFGVVLLELITGRKAIDESQSAEEQILVAWARPLLKDRWKFSKMADPLLQGRYALKGLYQAFAVAAMCLREQATRRPVIGDVVTALSYIASQTYDPNTPPSHHSRDVSSTPPSRDERKNVLSATESLGSKDSAQSSDQSSPDLPQMDSIGGVRFSPEVGRTESGSSHTLQWKGRSYT